MPAPVVTALRRGRRGRVAVELDGTPWRELPEEAVVAAGLAAGLALDRGRARRLRRELRRREALDASLRALRWRDLSERRLAERLEHVGVSPAVREEALGTLERAGLLDDSRFARRRAEALAERGLGDAAIRDDLERQGVPAELLEEALAELEPERVRAERLARRLGGGAKTAAALARRGFDGDAIEAVVGTFAEDG